MNVLDFSRNSASMPPMSTPASFRKDDIHGRATLPGARDLVPTRRHREITHARKTFIHRTKNGVYDPLTYYHILDALLDLRPNELFRAADFVNFLRATRPQMVWDSTTVGRVITDMAESLVEANAMAPISADRRWNGMTYTVSGLPELRAAMEHLLDDLKLLCEAQLEAELKGDFPKRVESPMIHCPSVRLPVSL